MHTATLFTLLIGGLTVLQAGINRQIMTSYGLVVAVFINAMVLFTLVGSVWFTGAYFPQWVPNVFEARISGFQMKWWYVLPGICGFTFVSGLPWAFSKIGAVQVFLLILIGQLISGMIWDAFFEGIPVSSQRVAGIVIVVLGVAVGSWNELKNAISG